MIATAGAYNDILKEKLYNKDSAVHCGRSTERVYKRVVPFICTDSFLPLTCSFSLVPKNLVQMKIYVFHGP